MIIKYLFYSLSLKIHCLQIAMCLQIIMHAPLEPVYKVQLSLKARHEFYQHITCWRDRQGQISL